jgi:predicted dehydrogenase
MSRTRTRREFLKQSVWAGAGLLVLRSGMLARGQSPNEKLNIAVIGVNGRGAEDLKAVESENIVALCDADEKMAVKARERYPDAKFYTDFRRLFDQKGIDAVVVGTPDHTHAPATMMALKSGKHVYCEKPLTHSVYEARMVAETAAKQKRVTQMGIQIHNDEANYRRVVEVIQQGTIGPIEEAHVWCGKSWVGHDRPQDTPPVPPGLNWDAWLGPAPYRPYHPDYLPAKWRGWWDFGSGTLGDMACHYMDLPFWALDLRYPATIESEGPPVHPESAPTWQIVRYEFPKRRKMPPVKLTWYHGRKRPQYFAEEGKMPKWGDGVLFVGKKGMLIAEYTKYKLLPEKDFEGFVPPKPYIPDSIGHHDEWIEACKTGGKTTCNFDYSGALTEAVLLGNVAYRSGKKIAWDAKRLRITNAPDAAKFLKRDYREGWTL